MSPRRNLVYCTPVHSSGEKIAVADAPAHGEDLSGRLDVRAGDRLLVLAPHPDDETLGTGGLLQRVRDRDATARVVFITSGERNPWAQRATERRLVITRRQRAAFGARREREAVEALRALGVPSEWATFWRFPDQGLTAALLSSQCDLQGRLAAELATFRPSVVVFPSPLDLHPDHSALGVTARVLLGGLAIPRQLCYLIHHPALRQRLGVVPALELGEDQRTAKVTAIRHHVSQLFWRRRWMEAFANATEPYCDGRRPPSGADHPITVLSRDGAPLRLAVHLRLLVRAWGPTTLVAVAARAGVVTHRVSVPLHRIGRTALVSDPSTGATLGHARLGPGGAVELPTELLPVDTSLFLKVERRFGFFDEAGWREVGEGSH